MVEWNNDLTMTFLEMYQRETIIWDTAHAYHKDKKEVKDAWLRISEDMGCSVAELKKKKDSLLATFRSHVRKKKASIRSGASIDDLYKPVWFAFDFMETFLLPDYDCNPTIDSSLSQMMPYSDEDSDILPVPQKPPTFGKSQNASSTMQHTTRRQTSGNLSKESPSSVVLPTDHHCNSPPQLQEAWSQMKEAFTIFNNVVAKKATARLEDAREEDECDLFGKMLAKKLRKVPENEREMIMYDIDGIFIRRNRRNFSPPTFSPNDPLNQSPILSSIKIQTQSPPIFPVNDIQM